MNAYDYSRAVATAQRLIARYGRLVALQGVSAGPADANNPLAGPAAAPDPIQGVPAAFVDPASLRGLGISARMSALFADCTQIALVAPVSGLPGFGDMKFLTDSDNSEWKINVIDTLKPGETVVLYFIGVVQP
jgi:hypothetical protein